MPFLLLIIYRKELLMKLPNLVLA